MEGTSSFAQLEAAAARGWRAVGTPLAGALEGAAASIPLSLGCATLVFSRLGPDLMASGVFATMLGLVFIHLATAGSSRPVCFSGRIFEATTLAAMMDQVIVQLPAWGIADAPGVRLAFLCAIGAGSGLCVALLYLVRAERLTPFIPAPVFAGFSNSIAVALLVSQSRSLWQLLTGATLPVVVLSVLLAALATAFVLRRWFPARPAAAAGLAAGLLAGLAWTWAGSPSPMVASGGRALALPLFGANFQALLAPEVRAWPMLLVLAGNAAILGIMIFINTAMAAQALTQLDGRRPRRNSDGPVAGAAMALTGFAGAVPISGSILVCLAVARGARVDWKVLPLLALVVALVHFTGVLGWVPLAAVAGVLLCEAWFMVDRPSVRLLGDWMRGRALAENAREDLALIAAVTTLAVVANMVVAAFAGLVLGLFLVALRSARRPVRRLWTGRQVTSNCARGSADLRLLGRHGEELRVFELEGDLFFAVGASLEQSLHAGCAGAASVVLDWSRVRHVDSSVANMIAGFVRQAGERGLFIVHAGAGLQQGNVAEELARRAPAGPFAPDLDYALEVAENALIQRHGGGDPTEVSALFATMDLFNGLSPAERAAIEAGMSQRLYRTGDVILSTGEVSDSLMLILQGCASVIVPGENGEPVRLAGLRRGAIVGEVGFLDGSPRSASVIAQEDVVVAVLTRADYDRLCVEMQSLVPKLLANIALVMAARLRHAGRLRVARARG